MVLVVRHVDTNIPAEIARELDVEVALLVGGGSGGFFLIPRRLGLGDLGPAHVSGDAAADSGKDEEYQCDDKTLFRLAAACHDSQSSIRRDGSGDVEIPGRPRFSVAKEDRGDQSFCPARKGKDGTLRR